MPCISKALIVGGGIAGLSCAIALSRAGVRCDVVELSGVPAGASIGITGRAADALGELGVYDACFATSAPFERDSTITSQFDADGRLESRGPPRPDWPGSKVGLGVYRPAFLQVLTDAARREGADLRIGLTVTAIEEQADGVLARFHAMFTRLLDSFRAPAMVALRGRYSPDAELIVRPFEWLLVPRPWHRGRTLLIGDAAHATTAHLGMGGGMALEDAVVLGQCVRTASTLGQALDTFMARRFDRVRTVVETSLALSRLEQAGAPRTETMGLMKTALATLAESY